MKSINGTQRLVLGFFIVVWIALVLIFIFAPRVYGDTLRPIPGDPHVIEAITLVALSALITVLMVGVVRRWRWAFWLILIAFLFGVLRVPASLLQLTGLMAATGPAWYEAFQGLIGIVQFVIALAMFSGYRKAGGWGEFRSG
ncbi:MAG TPA: hypothetical protein VLS53_05920 [Candidatus Dormibacteraeota bacterium]|nr:hypothetical protein [Candidatus Dormibacteraeota bacterium]